MTPHDAVDALMRDIPEFAAPWNAYKSLVRRDQSDPYIVFGEFGAFLRTVVPQRSLDNHTIVASFRFLTALGDSENPEVRDLIAAGTLDLLLDTPETIRAARQLLYGRALASFEELIQSWECRHRASVMSHPAKSVGQRRWISKH